jgi:hypothetical protein
MPKKLSPQPVEPLVQVRVQTSVTTKTSIEFTSDQAIEVLLRSAGYTFKSPVHPTPRLVNQDGEDIDELRLYFETTEVDP